VGKRRIAADELQSAQTQLLRNELSGESPLSRSQLAARAEQLKEQLRGLDEQLQIVRRQQSELDVTSPLDGTVLTWDAARQLVARPVKRGDSLLTVADTAGTWELLLDVPDRHAGHVVAAHSEHAAPLSVSFQLGTEPGTIRHGSVKSVASAAQLSESGQPAVRVTAALKEAHLPHLRPGATVVAKIHCGRRSLGYVWLHDPWDAVRSWLLL
jgi:hypothetical protein